MKKMMILVSTIMMVATGNAKNVETKPFEGVKVNVPARVRFVNGENYEMGLRSTDNTTAENIQWSIKDGVLTIRTRHESETDQPADLCITIVAPIEPKLMVGSRYEVAKVEDNRQLEK